MSVELLAITMARIGRISGEKFFDMTVQYLGGCRLVVTVNEATFSFLLLIYYLYLLLNYSRTWK